MTLSVRSDPRTGTGMAAPPVRIALVLALLAVVATSGGAQQPDEPTIPRVSLHETAAALARSGAANNDARTVLAAAQLLITAGRRTPGLERVEPASRDTIRPEELQKGVVTAAGLLRLASRIAVEQQDAQTARVAADLAGNPDVGLGDAALALELRTAADGLARTRGRMGGPVWSDGFLVTNEVAEFRLSFQGGYVPNKLSISASSPQADLDCYLYDGRQLVARDNGYGGNCTIRWSQRMTGVMTLRVRNAGVGTYFTVVSN